MSRVGHIGAIAWRRPSRQRRALIAAGTGGLVLSGLAFAIVLTSDQPGDRLLIAFGRLLVVAGYAWFLGALAESSNSVLYSIGRIPCADSRQARWAA